MKHKLVVLLWSINILWYHCLDLLVQYGANSGNFDLSFFLAFLAVKVFGVPLSGQ